MLLDKHKASFCCSLMCKCLLKLINSLLLSYSLLILLQPLQLSLILSAVLKEWSSFLWPSGLSCWEICRLSLSSLILGWLVDLTIRKLLVLLGLLLLPYCVCAHILALAFDYGPRPLFYRKLRYERLENLFHLACSVSVACFALGLCF